MALSAKTATSPLSRIRACRQTPSGTLGPHAATRGGVVKQVHILVVATQPHLLDVRGESLKQTVREDLDLTLDEVRTASLYTVHAPITPGDLEEARRYLFTDAVVQESYWTKRPPGECDWI